MATYNLAPVLKQRFLDANGLPLAGGKLYTYQSGTTTPQATYTDSTGVTPNANPVILDSRGEANVWFDSSLSYKIVLKDSSDVTIFTTDGIIGLLANNAVSTASLQDLCVTTAKIADLAVTAAKLSSSVSTDSSRAVTTDHIRNAAITRAKLASLLFIEPTVTRYTTGSGTHNLTYLFIISTGSATVGATYTHNSVTYTVGKTVASGTLLKASGNAAPLTSGTLTKTAGTGDSTITFIAYQPPVYLKAKLVGGGGGGGGSALGAGSAGNNTTFGSSLLTAGLGAAGSSTLGGAGGAVTVNSPAVTLVSVVGGQGGGALLGSGGDGHAGGVGGNAAFGGGAGSQKGTGTTAGSGATNSGAGGAGGGGAASAWTGSGGGAGGYIEALIPGDSLTATYAYAVGAGGAAGGNAGAGGSGIVIVEEHFQ